LPFVPASSVFSPDPFARRLLPWTAVPRQGNKEREFEVGAFGLFFRELARDVFFFPDTGRVFFSNY